MANGVSQELLEAAKIINAGEKDFAEGRKLAYLSLI
jgi:hypothetical protein